MFKQILIIPLVCFTYFSSYSQSYDDNELTLFKNEIVFGAGLQSAGILAINFRKGFVQNNTISKYYELELANLQHPKEFSDPRFDYIFKPGKINTVWTLRSTVGKSKILTQKLFGGIGLSWAYNGGLSLAIVKPIFVSATHNHNHTGNAVHDEVVEKYNPEEHSIGNIQNKESYFKGITNAKIHPGAFFKTGLKFDYSPYSDKVRGIEIGANIDYYLKEIPIMAAISNDNQQLFWAIYVNFLWGKKW